MYYVFSLQAELSNGSLMNKKSKSKLFMSKEMAMDWYKKAVKKLCNWTGISNRNTGKCTLIEARSAEKDDIYTGYDMKIIEETIC